MNGFAVAAALISLLALAAAGATVHYALQTRRNRRRITEIRVERERIAAARPPVVPFRYVRITSDAAEALDEIADRAGVTEHELVQLAVERHIERHSLPDDVTPALVPDWRDVEIERLHRALGEQTAMVRSWRNRQGRVRKELAKVRLAQTALKARVRELEALLPLLPEQFVTDLAVNGEAFLQRGPDGGTVVLDPFSGSGSTLRAAVDAGIKAIGIEKSERYCEMAVERLRQGSLFGAAS